MTKGEIVTLPSGRPGRYEGGVLGVGALFTYLDENGQPAFGVLTIAGPTVRFTRERMQALVPELLATADQLAAASGASPFFQLTAQTGGANPAASRKPIYAV